MKKLFIFFLVTIFGALNLIMAVDVRAADYAQVSLSYIAHINEGGIASIHYDFTITNATKTHYIESYSIVLPFTHMDNLYVAENNTPTRVKRSVNGLETTLQVTFKKELIGQGDSTKISIEFLTSELVSQDIHKVLFIKGVDTSSVTIEDARISIDKGFGGISFHSLPDDRVREEEDLYILSPRKNDLNRGITIEFEDEFIYHFVMDYHLENTSEEEKTFSMAVPPQTQGQNVYLTDETNQPDFAAQDRDGNILAYYQLGTGEQKEVLMEGYIEITHKGDISPLPDETNREPLTTFPVDHEKVNEIREDAIRRHNPPAENARNIHNYLVTHFDPVFESTLKDYERGKNFDSDALTSMDYTDLFTQAARAEGIQTRMVLGVVVNQTQYNIQKNQTHTWIEIYDSTLGWVPFDPFWEDVIKIPQDGRVSSNHVILSIANNNQIATHPLASLAENPSSISDIWSISPIRDFKKPEDSFEVSLIDTKVHAIGRTFPLSFTLANNSGKVAIIDDVEVDGYKVSLDTPSDLGKVALFPYQDHALMLNVTSDAQLPLKGEEDITLQVRGYTMHPISMSDSKTISFNSTSLYIFSWIVVLLFVVFIGFTLYSRTLIRNLLNLHGVRIKRPRVPVGFQ